VLIVLLALYVPPILIRHQALTIVPSLNLIDDSWILDASYKAAQGIWLGRDVAFTLGPAYQWLSSAPTRWLGTSSGTIYATWYTLPLFVVILATFFTARLLLPATAAWRRALFVLLAVIFWSPPDVRVSLSLLAFAIFLRLTDAVAASISLGFALIGASVAAATICTTAFLVSADTGLYVLAAFLFCLMVTAIARGSAARLARFLLVTAVCLALLVLLTNAAMASPLDFRFWHTSLAIANGYRWFEPTPMVKHDKHLVLETLALGVVVFGAASRLRNSTGSWTRRPAFLLSGFCLAFLMMQSALVRSDQGHVLIGIYPMIFLCGAIAMDEGHSGRLLSLFLPAVAVVATVALAHPFGAFVPRNAWAQWREMVHPILTCPAEMREFDHACFSAKDAALLTSVSTYTDWNTAPGDRIAVFPYETAFGLTSRRQVAGGVLQSYLVNGDYLTRLDLAGLRQADPPFALYLPDGVISIALDGVPNFTRSPDVWFYFLRHYRAEGSPAPGVLGLVRDHSRNLSFREQKIAEPIAKVRVQKRKTSLDLGAIHWPADGADFLKLRLRVNYPPWWRLRKPSCLTLQLSFANGSEKWLQFVIEPNRPAEVWIYPWKDQEMGRYFSANEADWPREGRSPLTRLGLLITPFDWISVVPTSVKVESVAAVRIDLK